eukprot:SAG22_NODE_1_length_62449_cov_158.689270_25_plen_106_part_00
MLLVAGCQTCAGNSFSQQGTASGDHPQDIVFGCIEYASTYCEYSATTGAASATDDSGTASSSDSSEERFLAEFNAFAACSTTTGAGQEGYCRGALVSAVRQRSCF